MIEGLAFPNSAFVSAPERAVLKGGRWKWLQIPVRYGKFTRAGEKCLIDTGYSARVTRNRRSLPLALYSILLRPKLTAEELPKAAPVIDTILLTHLHADHVSALRDYPQAKVYVDGTSFDHFMRAGWFGRTRHGCFKELFPEDLADRIIRLESLQQTTAPLGLGPAWDVFGDGSVLAVPLPGHMRGHTGYVFPKLPTPLLYAADAQWLARAIMEDRSPGPPAKWIMHDPAEARETGQRIAAFSKAGGKVVFCHDPEPLT